MKIAVFGESAILGVVQDDRILDLAAANAEDPAASPFPGSLLALIEAGEAGLDRVRDIDRRYAGHDRPDLFTPIADARFHAPFPGRRLGAAGNNHAAHVANARTNRGTPTTADAVRASSRKGLAGGFWTVSDPVGDAADIAVPRRSNGLFDYEGELGIILGRGGKRLRADNWRNHVWGVTLVIDWSIRPGEGQAVPMPFYGHKVFDGSKSMGPWIAIDEVDPPECMIETRVNGECRQHFRVGDMIHSFGELLEQVSDDLTLHAGDMFIGGTGPGTAFDTVIPNADGTVPRDLFLKPGDRVEVSAEHLGTLRAAIVAND